MNFFMDIEKAIEAIGKNTSAFESALGMLDGIISGLQGVLNAPNQHEKLQQAVNALSENKGELASAVVANTTPTPTGTAATGD